MHLTSTRRAARRLTLALVLALPLGCATNPVTGKRQLSLISESQEIEMGRQASRQAAQGIGLVQDQALQAYVQRVGASLAAASERPTLPWSFQVLDDPTPNAFAFPGGFIFVTRGLLSLMGNESELASVLGHEIGHVTARHSVTQISRAQLAQVALGLGGVLLPGLEQFGGALGSAASLVFLKYGRDAERQADELGFRYALNEGYDVREMDDVFRSLGRLGDQQQRSPLPTWLATHPSGPERIRATEERIAALQTQPDTARLGRAVFLSRLEGLVHGENPRSGFFRGSEFYHPDLRFRLRFPQGWRLQNLPQAVMAASPQQDALIQLTLAQGGAEAAARGFFTQQGVQAGAVGRESIQGIPAVVGRFQAQTQQGVLEGLAAFFDFGGRTYQLIGFGPAGQFARHDAAVRQTLGSFAALTDPQILGVQPNRIRIVRIDRTMTLADFNQRYPSSIPIEQLAILNQVEGPGSSLQAGTPVKRVVQG